MKREGCSVFTRKGNIEAIINLSEIGKSSRFYLGKFKSEEDGHKAIDTAISILNLNRDILFSGAPIEIQKDVIDRLEAKEALPTIQYQEKKGDMFRHAPRKAILTHACNAQGKWGRGIAYTFKTKFPRAYIEYSKYCQGREGPDPDRCGRSLIAMDSKLVGCLITSWHWNPADKPEVILKHTAKAVKELIGQAAVKYPGYEIHSCKINSGLFGVDWDLTKTIIKKALLESPDISWVVWEYP